MPYCYMQDIGSGKIHTESSLVPRPARRFRLHERTRRAWPGMFPHVRDVEGRKVVERT